MCPKGPSINYVVGGGGTPPPHVVDYGKIGGGPPHVVDYVTTTVMGGPNPTLNKTWPKKITVVDYVGGGGGEGGVPPHRLRSLWTVPK